MRKTIAEVFCNGSAAQKNCLSLSFIDVAEGNRNYRITEKDWNRIAESMSTITIFDLLDKQDQLSSILLNDSKYRKLKKDGILIQNMEDISEMINYNIKLVWLHESVIPDTIIQFMNQQEYKVCDIKYIKSNYKVMLNEDSDIQNLFESIFFFRLKG